MRRRLVLSNLVIVGVPLLLLSVLTSVIGAVAIGNAAHTRLRTTAQRIALGIEALETDNRPVTQATVDVLTPDGEVSVVTLPGGRQLTSRSTVTGGVITQTVRGAGVTVTLSAPASEVTRGQWASVLGTVGLAVAAGLVAVGLAVFEARRLATPLADLADTAQRLGDGDTRPSGRRYGVPELDRVATALDLSALRINRLVAHERRLTADASHQLRSPLTALSLRLEEIADSDDADVTREEAAAALLQVERLSAVVEDLLTGRSDHGGVPRRLGEVLSQQRREWAPAFEAADRSFVVAEPGEADPLVPGGVVAQVLAALIENALQHGDGDTEVQVRASGPAVVVEVSDEGAGIPDDLVAHLFDRAVSGSGGTGIGLALARAAAESIDARLELVRAQPATFALFLPVGGGSGPVAASTGNTQVR